MPHKKKVPDPSELAKVARFTSDRLTRAGIPHLVIGGLAVAARGYLRATSDVDFLVSRTDLGKLTGQPLTIGVTERVGGVNVDFVTPEEGDEFLAEYLRSSPNAPVAPAHVLVFLKMRAGRKRDQGDIVELLKRGKVDLPKTRTLLAEHGDEDMRSEFESLVLVAESEVD